MFRDWDLAIRDLDITAVRILGLALGMKTFSARSLLIEPQEALLRGLPNST